MTPADPPLACARANIPNPSGYVRFLVKPQTQTLLAPLPVVEGHPPVLLSSHASN